MRAPLHAALVLALTSFASPALADDTCKLVPIGTAEVAAVRDGRTFLLKDGRELRLAAIEVAGDKRKALETLFAENRAPLRLEKLGPDRDRYGRLVAFVSIGDPPQSLQQKLLALGAARVSSRVGDTSCAKTLLAAEKEAREARRGLWADPNFAPLQAENLSRLRAEAGHFALVEGKVLSVHVSGPTIYLNFGRNWTRDFSAMIPRRHLAGFAAAGLEPKGLAGKRVRVRGFIEQRRGPLIEADAPEQIELID